MQDKYVGDIGDFGKFILIKKFHEAAGDRVKLGLNWYYVQTRECNNDGKHTNYLDGKRRDKFAACDPDLHSKLRQVVRGNKRSLAQIQQAKALPPSIICFDEPLVEIDKLGERTLRRRQWFEKSLADLRKADIIFVDPDNGFCEDEIARRKKGRKYILLGEIEEYWKAGKSLVVYQHLDRTPAEVYRAKIDRVAQRLKVEPLILRFHAYSVRDYIMLMQASHQGIAKAVHNELIGPRYKLLFRDFQTRD